VVTRRTVYELKKARERGHILEGLAVALSNVDEVIELIKKAPSPGGREAGLDVPSVGLRPRKESNRKNPVEQFRPEGLAQQFGLKEDGYHLSDEQAQAILELRLQRLTGSSRTRSATSTGT